jgi:hypothetical protein
VIIDQKKLEGKSPQEISENPVLRTLKEKYDLENIQNKEFKEFAKLDLGNLQLKIQGVNYVPISDRKNTQIFPSNREVVINNNLDFSFSGWVNAGKIEVNVLDGYFDYGKFVIHIHNSDKTFLRANPMRQEDGKSPIVTQSYITGIRGEIFVDDPKNKSGANEKQFANYPRVISRVPTKVFYNSKSIARGAYDTTRFYFELEPFEIDSAYSFNEKALRLTGEMISGGIFPKFKHELKIMPDYSLGFIMDAPKEGFEFYGSGSRYNNQIVLSGNGLQGNGTIEHVTTKAESIGLLTFTPDSTIGVAKFLTAPRDF